LWREYSSATDSFALIIQMSWPVIAVAADGEA